MEYLGDGDIVNAALKYSGNDFNILESTFEGLGITNETFGLDVEDWESILDKTQEAGFAGDSMEDVFAREIGKDYLSIGEDAIKELLPEGETPEWVDNIVDTAQEAGREIDKNIIQPVIAPVKDVAEGAEEILGEVGEVVEKNITEPADEALDKFGEETVDPTLQAIDETIPHGETPELPEGPDGPDLPDLDLDLNLQFGRGKKSQIASLFDKELTSQIYQTPIEQYKPAFDEDQIQGMLQQRYRG